MSPKDTVRLMTAKGAQVPTLIELGGFENVFHTPDATLYITGNPGLQPSIVKNTELSYDHSFARMKVGVRLFDQTSDNIKGQPTGSASYDNVANSKMNGFELSASGKLGTGYRWSADYTATNVSDKAIADENLVARQANYADLTPKARANANLGWQGGKWTIDAFVHYTSDFSSFAPSSGGLVKIKAYTAIAGNVSYNLGNGMDVSLSGQNLGNSHQVQTAGLKVPSTLFISLSKRW
jgi:outer membrane receptor for ferrienterochelin and colicins